MYLPLTFQINLTSPLRERGEVDEVRFFYLCGMVKLILWGFLIYFLYNLIFRFIVPVGKVASQMKGQVKKMQEQQEAARKEFEEQQRFQQQAANPSSAPKKDEDYIDFEEVK